MSMNGNYNNKELFLRYLSQSVKHILQKVCFKHALVKNKNNKRKENGMGKAMGTILRVQDLSVTFQEKERQIEAVKHVSLELESAKVLALVGESGSGKTVLCKTILKLLSKKAKIEQGEIWLEDKNLLELSEKKMEMVRGKDISMVFQDPMTSLNPTISIGKQIMEAVLLHEKVSKQEAKKRTLDLLQLVGIEQPEKRFFQHPHHFSGGMRQRVAIAIALACQPKLLLADEPTTALDQKTQQQIIVLLKNIQVKTGVSIIFITHDLSLVETIADRVAVMYCGEIVEENTVARIFATPRHEYTRKLLGYVNYGKGKSHTHGKIHFHHGIAHTHAIDSSKEVQDAHTPNTLMQETKTIHSSLNALMQETQIEHRHSIVIEDLGGNKIEIEKEAERKQLEIKHLSKYFKLDRHTKTEVLKDVSMDIYSGEIVGIVGTSGCGKSTLAKCIMGLYKPDSGEIIYYGDNTKPYKKQMIFQDSASALNPRMTLEEIIAEPLKIKKLYQNKKDLKEQVYYLMEQAELDTSLAKRHPYDVSGGQRQRAAIARAISVQPELIVADEPISSLDISIQAQIVHLFKKLQMERNLTIIFIAHDLPMVEHISDRIIYLEKI